MRQSLQLNYRGSECHNKNLLLLFVDLHHRYATKKSGATVDNFVQKMQKQMGVRLFGLAAYENEDEIHNHSSRPFCL